MSFLSFLAYILLPKGRVDFCALAAINNTTTAPTAAALALYAATTAPSATRKVS